MTTIDVPEATGERGWKDNVGQGERLLSVLAGGTLIAYGLSRRSGGGAALALLGGALVARGATGFCPVYKALGVEHGNENAVVPYGEGVHVTQSVTVNRSPEDLYQFWRNLERLPSFMEHLVSVRQIDDARSHWVARAPVGATVVWDAEIIRDVPGEMISWRSVDGADVDNAGSVHFDPGPEGRGTVVRVELEYEPPGGKTGAIVAKLFGEEPSQQVAGDLRRFKSLMEAGEVPSTDGQPSGRN